MTKALKWPYTLMPLIILLMIAIVLYYLALGSNQSIQVIYQSIFNFQLSDVMLWYSALPRFFAAILAGGALALAGCLFQEASRNVLASPNLLGVGAGAHLALVIGLSLFPSLVAGYKVFFHY